MTIFLPEEPEQLQRIGPAIGPQGWASGVRGASAVAADNINFLYKRERDRIGEIEMTADEVALRLGMEGIQPVLDERNRRATEMGLNAHIIDTADPAEAVRLMGPQGAKAVLDLARQAAAADPASWADMDVSHEGMEARLTERRTAERRDAQAIVALSPSPLVVSLVGEIAVNMADPRNLALVPFGLGGGSILKTMAREALLGATSEALTFGDRVDAATEFNEEAPGFVEALTIGALGGAVLGGGIEALTRGFSYYRMRQTPVSVPGVETHTAEAAVQAAENALLSGDDPLKAVADVFRTATPIERQFEPLIPDDIAATIPEPTALAPDPIASAPLEPVPGIPNTVDQVAATAKRGIAKSGKPRKEVLGFLKARGGVDPDGWLGTEMKARGLTHKSYPGLFKRGGISDIDNIPFDEVDPSISYRVGRGEDGLYLDRDGLLRVFDEEMNPAPPKAYNPDLPPAERYAQMVPAEDGFFVNVSAYQMDNPDWESAIEGAFDRYMQEAWPGVQLLPRERDEITGALKTRGGEARDLVERALEREVNFSELPAKEAMRYEPPAFPDEAFGPSASGAGQAGPDPFATGVSRAGSERDFIVEPTAAGDQILAPGIAPVSQRQRLEAQQAKPLRGGAAPATDGLFDVAGRSQMDMFSEPTGPAAMRAQDQMIADLENGIAQGGDFSVDLGDGITSGSALVRELKGDQDFLAVLDACGKPGRG